MLQVAEESLELLDAALDEALARRAFVVRGTALVKIIELASVLCVIM